MKKAQLMKEYARTTRRRSKSSRQVIYSLVAMLTVWCLWNSINVNNNYIAIDDIATEQALIDRVVANLVDRLDAKDRQEELPPEPSFNDVFKEMRSIYGPGHIFEYNDELFTTDYKEELEYHSNVDYKGQWVLNANDRDDFCKSNYHDECGICDGTGTQAWYLDMDGDGLGNANKVKLSCSEPTAYNN